MAYVKQHPDLHMHRIGSRMVSWTHPNSRKTFGVPLCPETWACVWNALKRNLTCVQATVQIYNAVVSLDDQDRQHPQHLSKNAAPQIRRRPPQELQPTWHLGKQPTR